jgi:hypothetical protein
LGVTAGGGDYEIALGKEPNRYGISAARMFADPGTSFEYSDAAFAHVFSRYGARNCGRYEGARICCMVKIFMLHGSSI